MSDNKIIPEIPKKRKAPSSAFKKGQSGNPGGRPKLSEEFKELARSKSVRALEVIIEIAENPLADYTYRLKACEIILDRAYGKPVQQVDTENKNNNAITINLDGKLKEWSQ